MSRSMHICCMKCKENLWVGQTDSFYSGMPEVMEALREFLVKHRTWTTKEYDPDNYHELLYMPEPYNGSFENIDWVEIEADAPVRSTPNPTNTYKPSNVKD